jgi:hypothetical protein
MLNEHSLTIHGFPCEPEKAELLGILVLNSTTVRFPVVELEADFSVSLLSRPALLQGCTRILLDNYGHWWRRFDDDEVFYSLRILQKNYLKNELCIW